MYVPLPKKGVTYFRQSDSRYSRPDLEAPLSVRPNVPPHLTRPDLLVIAAAVSAHRGWREHLEVLFFFLLKVSVSFPECSEQQVFAIK